MSYSINSNDSSGACSIAPANTYFNSLAAQWVVPNNVALNTELDSWIGLAQGSLHTGGPRDRHPEVVDGGIEANVFFTFMISTFNDIDNNLTVVANIVAPSPDDPDSEFNEYWITTFSVSCGDTISACICNDTVNKEVTFLMANNTTNNVAQVFSLPASNFQPNWAGCMVSITPNKESYYNGNVVFENTALLNNGYQVPPSKTLDLTIQSDGQDLTLSRGSIIGSLIVCSGSGE